MFNNICHQLFFGTPHRKSPAMSWREIYGSYHKGSIIPAGQHAERLLEELEDSSLIFDEFGNTFNIVNFHAAEAEADLKVSDLFACSNYEYYKLTQYLSFLGIVFLCAVLKPTTTTIVRTRNSGNLTSPGLTIMCAKRFKEKKVCNTYLMLRVDQLTKVLL